jgi:hypothetical protein
MRHYEDHIRQSPDHDKYVRGVPGPPVHDVWNFGVAQAFEE